MRRLIALEVGSGHHPSVLDHADVLFDPAVEHVAIEESRLNALDVFYRSGVTDSEGDSAALALGLACPGVSTECRSGRRYCFASAVPPELRPVVERIVGNPLIHSFCWSDEVILPQASWRDGRFPVTTPHPSVRRLSLLPDDGALLHVSRAHGLALDLAEMRAIEAHFRALGRAPTDVEIQSLALAWSEHCSHKTFKATVDLSHDGREERIEGLLAGCIVEPSLQLNRPWVRSAFSDNAGVIAFDDNLDLAFKVETHNHPSALEPFGGAHTGVGGVIRDVLAVSAEPIANTDVLCFGPLDYSQSAVAADIFHPSTTCQEVVRGVADYGNNMGIPTVGGALLFHPGYVSNPLVFCGTVGIAPRGSHPRAPQPGDVVLVLGGRTGRDGLHGATMSSARLDRATVEGTVVQIGNPITEKTLRDVIPQLRDERLYHAITDCGAGGLCSAVGEMGETLGVEVDLDLVPLKYPGLEPWEIWLSEAQERMVLAVPPASVGRVMELCRAHDVEATAIGRFRDDGMLCLRFAGEVVGSLHMDFLHRGRPPRHLQARWESAPTKPYSPDANADLQDALLTLLRHPTIASKEDVIRRYDHEVGAATIVKPLVGDAGPSDAAALKPLSESWQGVVVAHGINPLYGSDPHAMAMLAVDEALRNLVAVGGSIDRCALLDNFCWGDVGDPFQLGGLTRAAQGCRDATQAYGTPFVSGKDSLYNSSTGENTSIPGTLLISAIGVIPDVRRTVTMDLKGAGNWVYLLGLSADELGGSFYLWLRASDAGRLPAARPAETTRVMRSLTGAIQEGVVRSCHDLSEGGLAVAAAEAVIAGRLGLSLDLDRAPVVEGELMSDEALLFGESPGRFLVEVRPEDAPRFEERLGSLPHARLGTVDDVDHLTIRRSERTLVDADLAALAAAWRRQ